MPLIIVEGIDRVGKTTICKSFEKNGYRIFKDAWLGPIVKDSALEKLNTCLQFFELFKDQKIVVDRFHLTEFVYGKIDRGYETNISSIDRRLDALDAQLLLVVSKDSADLARASREHGSDLAEHEKLFYSCFIYSQIKRKFWWRNFK